MSHIYLRDNTNMNMDIVNIISSYTDTRPEWVKFWNEILISSIMVGHENNTVRQQIINVNIYKSFWLYMIDPKLCNIQLCKADMLEEFVQTRALIK
jgi:hypothetical protein